MKNALAEWRQTIPPEHFTMDRITSGIVQPLRQRLFTVSVMLAADVQPSAIDVLNDQDLHNYAEVRRNFRHETCLADDVLIAYNLCAEALQPHLQTQADRIASALLVGICRNHLVLGATALFRIHAAQMFRETRSAVESAGIAYVVRRDSAMLQIFLEDDGRPIQREAAKKAFRRGKIFPQTEPVLAVLGDEYDLASYRAHTNILSFVSHLAKTRMPGLTQVSIQDIAKGHIPQFVPLHIFWLAHAHIAILLSALATFPDLPSAPEVTKFKKELEYVNSKIARFKTKLDEESGRAKV